MKNLLISSAIIYSIVACTTPKAKNYECKEYSFECELQKDRILILPINFDSKTLDAYGYQIGNNLDNQWYIVSKKNRILVPVPISVCTGGNINNGIEYTDCPLPTELLRKFKSVDRKIRIDTVDMSSLIPTLSKVAVVISGPNEIMHSENSSKYLATPK